MMGNPTALQIVWFTLIAILWSGYFFLEGFDFGVGMLLGVLGKSDMDRRLMINAIGPTWDGNEVWLLVAGGATFAAFPVWYATVFSAFYLALFLILAALIFRGVAFEYRGKGLSEKWRKWWDAAIILGSAIPAILWGVAFGDFVHGIPLNQAGHFTGNFFSLLSPYSIFTGLTTGVVFATHGALFLSLKTTGELRKRTQRLTRKLAPAAMAFIFAFLAWTYFNANHINDTGVVPGILPVGALMLAVAAVVLVQEGYFGWAFTSIGASIVGITATLFLNLYPRVLVSSTNNAFSLTIPQAASAHYTLVVMTIVAAIFTPLVLLYQGWTYYVFRKRISIPGTGGEETMPSAAPTPE
ncbi:MAG: cytochrome d ubiquinol oxidase subunit II [Actinomycetota bacterium]|nr:cytochrome d ubiquinol oxidase subunit II [Actinomycetota bacterium]